MRYLFICGDVKAGSGGTAVIYDMVHFLSRLGYEAAVVHPSADGHYQDYPAAVPTFYSPQLKKTLLRHAGRKANIRAAVDFIGKLYTPKKLLPVFIRPTDIIIAAEFLLDISLEAFPKNKVGIFVQNPFALVKAFFRALDRGYDPITHVIFWLSVADICTESLELIGAQVVFQFPVSMNPHLFQNTNIKKERIISYMPRKRPDEARLFAYSKPMRDNPFGYKLVEIRNKTIADVRDIMAQSRIFVSFLKDESIGFPAAEAMASGCIVVGFDGLGGSEFFDRSTGFPVRDGDVAALVKEVESVIRRYEADPSSFSQLLHRASSVVHKKFSRDLFEECVRDLWQMIHMGLVSGVEGKQRFASKYW